MRPSILVVESDPDIARLVTMLCESIGCDAITADTLPEARSALRRAHPPALMVLDIVLPKSESDAFEFCREIKRDTTAYPAVPVIVMSASEPNAARAAALAAGADAFFAKPFDPDALTAEMTRLFKPID